MQQMSSRERMLTALSCGEPDHVPCSFMIFSALREACRDPFEFVDRQLALGVVPEEGVDLFIRRAWYETAAFWSPASFRQFILPHLREDVRVAHQAGEVALWGGVNGFVSMERGTEEKVRRAVRDALAILAPGGGFILSPVDNVTVDTDRARANVRALIDEWQSRR